MEQDQKPIKMQGGDLERLLHDEAMDPEPEVSFEHEEVPGLWRYQVEVLNEYVGSWVKGAARGVGKAALYTLGGALPEKIKNRLEERLGPDLFDARKATLTNTVLMTPVYAGSVYAIMNSNLSEGWRIGLSAGIGIWGYVETLVRANRTKRSWGQRHYGIGAISCLYHAGRFIGGKLTAAQERVGEFRNEMRTEAEERRRKALSGKVDV